MSEPSNEYLDKQKESIMKKMTAINKTFPAFVQGFLPYCLSIKNAQPRTVLGYAGDLSVFFYFLIQNNPSLKDISDITPDTLNSLNMQDIQEYLMFLESYEKDGIRHTNGITGKDRKLASLRSFYKYLQNMQIITNNPTILIPPLKAHKKNIILLEHNEMDRFLNNVDTCGTLTERQKKISEKQNGRDTAIITILLHTGIRISELVGLDLKDIDYKEKSLRIIRKGGDENYVYMDDETISYLRNYIDNERPGNADLDAVFISRKGNRMSVRSVERMVKKYAAAIPNKHITPHKLRSTFATHLYRETGDIYLVKEALGHKSISSTSKYADIGNSRRREVPDKIEHAYENSTI